KKKLWSAFQLKTLLRFKSVIYTMENNDGIYQSRQETSCPIPKSETDDNDHHSKILIYSYKFPHSYPTFDYMIGRIVGYCNGLVCIYDLGHIFLINVPATRKLRTLSPELSREYTGQAGWSGQLPFGVGFGRDIVTRTYKLILMYSVDHIVMEEVFNLNDGRWRKKTNLFPYFLQST
ncbi:unnamed protein product, partial [Thlaspi arvense]